MNNNGIQGGALPRLAGLWRSRNGGESSNAQATRQLNENLAAWWQVAPPGEDRLEAARRILFCFNEQEPELNLCGLGLTRLPECLGELAFLSVLDVSHNRLDRLPGDIEELTRLRVLNLCANQFSRVPRSLLSLDAQCTVWMTDNAVSAEDCEAFQAISDLQDGPCVLVDLGVQGGQGAPDEATPPNVEQWEQPDLGQQAPLPQALALWRHDLGRLAERSLWRRVDHPHAAHFGGWLVRLRDTPDFANPLRRPDVIRRVREVLRAMHEDAQFRATCLHIAHESVGTCDDNVALGLNRLEMALHNHRAERGELSGQALFELGRGMFRLERISMIAEEKCRQLLESGRPVDQVDVHLAYQAGLRETLNLPVAVSELRFAALAGVTRDDLTRALGVIDRLEDTPASVRLKRYLLGIDAMTGDWPFYTWNRVRRHPVAGFLAESYQPWQNHVARAHAREITNLSEIMFGVLERIEEAKETGKMNDGEYLNAMNATKFYANHGVAYQKALEILVDIETRAADAPNASRGPMGC